MSDALLIELGKAVHIGMMSVDRASRFTSGDVIQTSWSTKFEMPDGRWWGLSLTPVANPENVA